MRVLEKTDHIIMALKCQQNTPSLTHTPPKITASQGQQHAPITHPTSGTQSLMSLPHLNQPVIYMLGRPGSSLHHFENQVKIEDCNLNTNPFDYPIKSQPHYNLKINQFDYHLKNCKPHHHQPINHIHYQFKIKEVAWHV